MTREVRELGRDPERGPETLVLEVKTLENDTHSDIAVNRSEANDSVREWITKTVAARTESGFSINALRPEHFAVEVKIERLPRDRA